MPRTVFSSLPCKIWLSLILTCFFVGIFEADRLKQTFADFFDEERYWERYLEIIEQLPEVPVLDKFSQWQSTAIDTLRSRRVWGQISANPNLAQISSGTNEARFKVTQQPISLSTPWSRVLFARTNLNFEYSAGLVWVANALADMDIGSVSPEITMPEIKFATHFRPKSWSEMTQTTADTLSCVHVDSLTRTVLGKPTKIEHNQALNIKHDPTKVLLVGDSLMMEGFGPVLLRTLRQRADFVVRREAKYSTGLSRPDYFNWEVRMAELVQEFNPNLVIICLGANDAQDIIDEQGKRHIAGTETWAEQYFKRALTLAEVAQSAGAKLIWVGLPIMGKEPHATRIKMLSQEQLAATLMAPASRIYVDTYAVLADEDGQYASVLPDENGIFVRMRYQDKIHVNEAGGQILVASVLPFVELFYPCPQVSYFEQVRSVHQGNSHRPLQ